MTSLFSPFDLNSFNFTFLSILSMNFLFYNLFFKINMVTLYLNSVLTGLGGFFMSLKPKMFNKMSGLFFFSIFMLLLSTNFLSVFSYNFPVSSQISCILALSLGSWVSFNFLSIYKNFNSFFSHLVPEGTPLPLTMLIFLIELVSSAIRPITLTVRLVANILAGHLLMILLSNLVMLFPMSLFFYFFLNLVEILVSMIQAYIFTTMIVLYFSEV